MSNSYYVVESTSNLRTDDPDKVSYSVENTEWVGIEGTFQSLSEAQNYIDSVGGTLYLIS